MKNKQEQIEEMADVAIRTVKYLAEQFDAEIKE